MRVVGGLKGCDMCGAEAIGFFKLNRVKRPLRLCQRHSETMKPMIIRKTHHITTISEV